MIADASSIKHSPRSLLISLVLLTLALLTMSVVVAAPAEAANPCIATAARPAPVTKSGVDYVRFYAQGECVYTAEYIRVVFKGQYRQGTSGSWNTLGDLVYRTCGPNVTHCPTTPSNYWYADRRDPAGCYYFRSWARIDVMYKGIPVWYNAVDYDTSDARYIC